VTWPRKPNLTPENEREFEKVAFMKSAVFSCPSPRDNTFTAAMGDHLRRLRRGFVGKWNVTLSG
jgi:hypothetical protein